MKLLSTVFWLIIIAIAVLFTSMNAKTVVFNYYVGQMKVFLPLLVLVAFALGVVLGMIAMLPAILRGKHRSRKLRHQLTTAEKELSSLRSMPLHDEL